MMIARRIQERQNINKSFSFSSSEQETEYTVHNSAGKEEKKKYDGHGRDWASEHSVSATYWDQPEHQPCPKGWRLPTKDEFLSIVPSSQNAGDITFLNHSGTYSITVNYDVHNEKAVYVGVPSDKKKKKSGYNLCNQTPGNIQCLPSTLANQTRRKYIN